MQAKQTDVDLVASLVTEAQELTKRAGRMFKEAEAAANAKLPAGNYLTRGGELLIVEHDGMTSLELVTITELTK